MNFNYNCDCLIIGSGVSGLISAISLAEMGLSVLIITKDAVTESSSARAQGGIAVPLSKTDSIQKHIQDTLKVGKGLAEEKIVEFYISSIKKHINKLSNWGIIFIGFQNGSVSDESLLGREAAHSERRILRVGGDLSGRMLMKNLWELVCRNPLISISQGTTLLKLISDETQEEVFGGVFQDINHNIFTLLAKKTISATGGFSSIFSKSTNPSTSTGDGIIVAEELNCELKDINIIQFHPTVLDVKPLFLLSEALRGEGAILLNAEHFRFMENYAPEEMELASRSVVSNAVWTEIKNTGKVYLDLRHLNKNFLQERFTGIYEHCLENGFDLSNSLMPITPAAHYTIGGIKIDINAKTNKKNLFAVGEVACSGLHGGDRLASNSLLECIVSAFTASENIQKEIQNNNSNNNIKFPDIQINDLVLNNAETQNINVISQELRELLWDKASIEINYKELHNIKDYLYSLKKVYGTEITQDLYLNQFIQQIKMSEMFIDSLSNQ